MLTDNGREFCGRPEQHPYDLLLAVDGIEHRTTKVRSPRTNGFVERMNRTLLDECFRVKGRTTWYMAPEEIQRNLDVFIAFYNEQRTPQGYLLKGRTPAQAPCARRSASSACLPSPRPSTRTNQRRKPCPRRPTEPSTPAPRLPGNYGTCTRQPDSAPPADRPEAEDKIVLTIRLSASTVENYGARTIRDQVVKNYLTFSFPRIIATTKDGL